MTVAISWVRTRADGTQELFVASDSRLNGGGNLDCAPKVLTLSRGDCALAFAGSTYFAYPLALQLAHAIQAHGPLRDRGLDYHVVREHALTIFNSMVASFTGVMRNSLDDTSFLLAGYSWARKEFAIDHLHWKPQEQRFAFRPCLNGVGRFGKFLSTGDWGTRAFQRLTELLKARHGIVSVTSESTIDRTFDMEPFEALRDLLRASNSTDSIGGPPQLVRISQSLNTQALGVRWTDGAGGTAVFLAGRPLTAYENIDHWEIDPDSMRISHPHYSP